MAMDILIKHIDALAIQHKAKLTYYRDGDKIPLPSFPCSILIYTTLIDLLPFLDNYHQTTDVYNLYVITSNIMILYCIAMFCATKHDTIF